MKKQKHLIIVAIIMIIAILSSCNQTETITCGACGASIASDVKFCPECGANFAQGTTVTPENSAAPDATVAPDTTATIETPETSHSHDFGDWVITKIPTCTENGKQERACVCGETEYVELSASGHIEVVDPFVAPTCTENGYTEGKHCSICNLILVKQNVVLSTQHTESDWIVIKEAGKSDDGLRHKVCVECETIMIEEIIPKTGSIGLEYEPTGLGNYCRIIGIGTCTDKEILIPEKLGGYRVYEISDEAFANCKDIVSVIIPKTAYKIGDKAFANCISLESIVIPDSITAIGNRAFYGCVGLTEITIPKYVKDIGTQIFYKADNLTTVYYYGKYFSEDNRFLDLPHIKKIVIGVEEVPSRFLWKHTGVEELELLDGVKGVWQSTFLGCTSLKVVKIPESVEFIENKSFNGCTSLERVDISNLTKWCNIWFGKYLPDAGTTRDVTSNPLFYAKNLYVNDILVTNLVIPESVTRLEGYNFVNCSINSVTLHENIKHIGEGAFFGCDNISTITIPKNITSIENRTFYKCSSLKKVVIPDSVKSIGDAAFSGCTGLTSITIPNSVTKIGSAFANCTSLTSITIPDSVTSINGAFSACTSLTSITIPDSVTNIEGAFSDCTSLTSITIPDSVTKISSAFSGCTALTSITIPGSVKSMGYSTFKGCTSLTSITIPNSVTFIGNDSFDGCKNLKDVYYTGTEAEWKAIEIDSYNGDLTKATIHYNSKN